MKEKIIGILGGMGPEATIDLFQKIVKHSPAKQDQDHLRIIIDNNPKIPDRSQAILEKGESLLPEMITTAKNLERAGANLIIMPCNTAHFFYDDLQKKINIPIIHMIKETAIYIHRAFTNIQRISLFATRGTYETMLYQTFLNKRDIETLIPTQDEQNKIMNIIYGIKAGNRLDLLKKDILKLAENQIAKNAQGIIACCTEIPLIFKNGDINIPVINPTLILTQISIEKAKK